VSRRLRILSFIILSSFLAIISVPAFAATTWAQQPVFAASGNPTAIVFSPTGATAYLANSAACTVDVVATSTNTVTAVVTIPSCGGISAMQILPDGSALWVATDSSIYSISTSTLLVSTAVSTFG
jgi:DNA-binding beta-propeller fold protein YncE